MTRIGAVQADTTNFYVYIYGLLAPATGVNNIVASTSSSTYIGCAAVSYTGVKQSGLPDSSATGTDATGNYTATTTVVASDCWLFSSSRSNGSPTAGASTTIRDVLDGGSCLSADSNATVGTGSQSLNFTVSPGGETGWLVCSFAPQVDVTMTAAQGSFALTGQDATLGTIVGTLIANLGSFILTGISASLRFTGWSNQSKNSSTFTNDSKNSSTWTNQPK